MKRFNYFFGLTFLSLITFFSCNEAEEGGLESPEKLDCTKGELTFTLNGSLWTATSFENTLIQAIDPQSGIPGRRCDIRAKNADGELIAITFANPGAEDDNCMVTGDYVSVSNVETSYDNVFFVTYLDSNQSMLFLSTEGTLSITDCDQENSKTMKGTFSFEDVMGEYVGADGEFSICIP